MVGPKVSPLLALSVIKEASDKMYTIVRIVVSENSQVEDWRHALDLQVVMDGSMILPSLLVTSCSYSAH